MWTFGTNELIGLLSAVITFLAVCVSLFLALKSKTLKFKIINKRLLKTAFMEKQFQQIDLLNNGYIKFTCTSIGYYIDKKYYFVDFIQGIKKLDNSIIEKTETGKNHIYDENLILPTYVHEGDMLQTAICPADYNFNEIKRNKKVYVFIVINGKIYKWYIGVKFNEFNTLIGNFKQMSLYNNILHGISGRNIKEIYLR